MPSLLARYQDDASYRWLLPSILLVASICAYLGTSVRHSLLTSAAAWSSICIYTALKTKAGGSSGSQAAPAQRLAWAAGLLLALGQICERAVDGRGIWFAKGLFPLAVYLFLRGDLAGTGNAFSSNHDSPPMSPDKSRTSQSVPTSAPKTILAILTVSAVIAIFVSVGTNATIALALSYAVTEVQAYLLIERAQIEARNGRASNGPTIYSANGLLAQPTHAAGSSADIAIAIARDVSTAAALATGIATLTLESFSFGGLAYYGVSLGEQWLFWQEILRLVFAVATVVVHIVMEGTLIFMIQRQGSFLTSLVPLFAAILCQLITSFSPSRLWFAALCVASTFAFLDEQDPATGGGRKRMRFTRIVTLIAIVSFGVYTVLYLREPYQRYRTPAPIIREGLPTAPPPEPLAPKDFSNIRVHPVDQLVRDAEASWQQMLRSQSQSLEAAVTEYRRRYGMPPPPNFDKWYELAKRKNVQLIDEYDSIYHSLLPFWGLAPATIRARAREAIGYADNMLMGLLLRDGKSSYVIGGQDWLQQAAVGMMEDFVQYLPDMDLAFNTHDEPRVVVPYGDLSRLVDTALKENIPKTSKKGQPRNAFSSRPTDVNTGRRVGETKTTRFNWYAHQPVWVPSRLSCPPESPARALDESQARDNLTAYALGELGFVYNHTAFSDICNSPSFSRTFGFFDRPNAFNTVHDLFPIFSQSKISSFQDILYPSPWYWYEKVPYRAVKDVDWKAKIPALFWRGSTTGGFSRDGGWRRQHRQHVVKTLNAIDDAKVYQDVNKDSTSGDTKPEYKVKSVPRSDYQDSMDVHFSHVGQCDPGDCDAQKEFFTLRDGVDQQDAWKWRYLLDMDGNAFSGRFYAFLKSKSLVFKMAVFREWHEEWIKPWVHYIPLSLRGEETLECVRYFGAEEVGRTEAVRLAEQGREWAQKALRNEDFEVWFFRLLLEYGRVVDDNRSEIGYAGS